MALATYSDLLTAIQNYEADATSIVTGIQADMVTLAEQRIFIGYGRPGLPFYSPPLRTRSMEKNKVIPIGPGLAGGTSGGSANAQTVTLTATPTVAYGLAIKFVAGFTNTGATTLNPNSLGAVDIRKGANRDALEAGDILLGGTYTVYNDGTYYVLMPSDGACILPASFLGVKGAYLQDRGQQLTPMPSSGINRYMDGATAYAPLYYAIDGDCMRFEPLPDQNYSLNLNYYARPSALSVAVNDVFRNAPGIYLFGALLELAIYLPNPDQIDTRHSQFMGALMGLQDTEKSAGFGYAPMRLRFNIAP